MTSPFGSNPEPGGPFGNNTPSPTNPGQSSGFGSSPDFGGTGSFSTPGSVIDDLPRGNLDNSPVTGPWAYIIASVVTAVIGVLLGGLAAITGSATDSSFRIFALIGWALSGIITFILLGIHTARDTRRRAECFYIEKPAQSTLYRLAAGVACLGVIITAIEIALWISKTVGA